MGRSDHAGSRQPRGDELHRSKPEASGDHRAGDNDDAASQPPAAPTAAPTDPATPGRRHRTQRKPFVLRTLGNVSTTTQAATARRPGQVVAMLQNLGPYLLIEMLLPGGTLIAFLLYVSRNGRPLREDAPVLATLAALTGALVQAIARRFSSGVFHASGDNPAERDGLEPLAMAPC